MKIQLALDTDLKKGMEVAKKISKYIDIIEIGTPLVKKEGINVIKKFKKFRRPIMADLKTMDTGSLEAGMAFKAGASISSVCGAADLNTIKGAIKEAKKQKKKVLVDLINVKDKKRIKKIIELGPNIICTHTGIDMQNKGEMPFEEFKKLKKISKDKRSEIAIAGGINLNSLKRVIKEEPNIIIIGGAYTKAKHPENVAKKVKEMINQKNG